MNTLQKIVHDVPKVKLPDFRAGDSVRVYCRIMEGEKERVQIFEGVVLSRRGEGRQASFTVRKISYGVGVERIFPTYSPLIQKIDVVQKGKVRRAKLYYVRELSGKKAKIQGESQSLGGVEEA
ncbi:MAG: 50S ribosomal protein L19 [Deltaproteobacteria bacterium]|nr:50S ribosomal protein L19 [Deltaproteobacteria bacterium]MBI4374611.1 50S ribosomal protein L19 [Deltaproteobacteria bacterium]